MTAVTITGLEGILQAGDGRHIDAGCRLYRAVSAQPGHQVIILTAGTPQGTARFLREQHLPAAAYTRHVADPSEWEPACSDLRRTYPYPIDYVITADPGTAAQLYLHGFRVMTMLDPRYSRPEWRPDSPGFRADGWDTLTAVFAADQEAHR